MQNKTLFLLPIVLVLLIGGYFGYRWWMSQTPKLETPPIVTTEELNDREQGLLKNFGIPDKNTAQLKSLSSTKSFGLVRWSDDGKSLTVLASLEDLSSGWYQAWLQTAEGKSVKLGTLVKEKGGYILDYSSTTVLPSSFTIVVSKETKNDGTIEEKVLEGEIVLEK